VPVEDRELDVDGRAFVLLGNRSGGRGLVDEGKEAGHGQQADGWTGEILLSGGELIGGFAGEAQAGDFGPVRQRWRDQFLAFCDGLGGRGSSTSW